jgi:hypothetical protein
MPWRPRRSEASRPRSSRPVRAEGGGPLKGRGCIVFTVALIAVAVALVLVVTGSQWGLDELMGTWASSKATGGDREGLRGAQARLRVEFADESGAPSDEGSHVAVDGTMGGERLSALVETSAWSVVWQELRLDLADGQWTLEVDDGSLVVTAPDGIRTRLAKLR